MIIHLIAKEIWPQLAENAHRAIFNEPLPASQERIDFALFGVDEQSQPIGYITCKEIEPTVLQWSFGGVMPNRPKSYRNWLYFQSVLQKCAQLGYEQAFFRVRNTNTGMLKFALKAGAVIVGSRTIAGNLWLEHLLELPCK